MQPTGVFAQRCKRQRLILLDKGKGLLITSSPLRPLCMLDNSGKVYEKMLRVRLRATIGEAGGLAERQNGFRMKYSTIGAIREVIQTTEEAWKGDHRTRDYCVLNTLDVRNAFNSAR